MSFQLSRLSLLAALSATVALAGCGPSQTAMQDKPTIYVDSYPVAYFAERMAGDDAIVVFPAPEDVDPAYWKPSDEIVRQYQDADLVLTSGPHYASWVSRASLPPKNVVDTTEGFPPGALVESPEAIVHSHGDEGEHSHEAYAIHTWLDPKLAQSQAESIRAALARVLPNEADEIDRRYAELRSDLTDLETRLEAVKKSTEGMPMIASHPVYDYLANAAGWKPQSLHWEPNEMPGEKEWGKLDAIREETGAKHMLWEDEPAEPIRKALEERGVEPIVIRHAGNRPPSGDFVDAMRANYDALATLKPEPTE